MTNEHKNEAIKPSLSLLYGGIAGCIAKTAIAPFDRVKIHFQVAHPEMSEYRGKLTGVFGAVRRIYLKFGFQALFRGHSATLARIFPYAAINYAGFEKFKAVLQADTGKNTHWPWKKMIAGSLAGTLAVTITYPFDIIRARLAYEIAHHPTKLSGWAHIKAVASKLLKEGRPSSIPLFQMRAFYQGFSPTVLGIIPYAGTSFCTFEYLKQILQNRLNRERLSSIQIFLIGLAAGAFGQTVAYPFDVLRRRMQLYRITDHLPHHHYSSGIVHGLRSVFRTHGVAKGIFAGLSINYVKVAPASGISFLVYERLKQAFPEGLL